MTDAGVMANFAPGVTLTESILASELRPVPGLADFDIALIRMLQEDGRRPVAEIARRLECPVKTVRRRMRELRSAGIIDITAVTDPEVLGFRSLALLGLTIGPPRRTRDIVADLAAIDQVDYLSVSSGRYNILVELVCRTPDEMLSLVEDRITETVGVRSVEIFPYLSLHYQRFSIGGADLPTEQEGRPYGGVGSGESLFDSLDQRIVATLNEDGRVPFKRIGERVGLSEAQVRRRFDRMLSSGALRVIAMTNPISLGFQTMAWLAIRVAPGARISTVANDLARIGAVMYVVICAGRYDIFADVACKDRADLLRLLDEQIRTNPGVMDVDSWIHLDLHWRQVRASQGEQTPD